MDTLSGIIGPVLNFLSHPLSMLAIVVLMHLIMKSLIPK